FPLGIYSLLRSRGCGREDFGPGDQPLNSAFGTPRRKSKLKLVSKKTGRPMPSCGKTLALGKLEPLAGAFLPILLALFAAGIAGKKTFDLKFLAQFSVELQQRAGNAQLQSAGLAVDSSTGDIRRNIERRGRLGGHERLLHFHSLRLGQEVLVKLAPVD